MGYEIEFYKTKTGRVPVDEFIKSLQKKQEAKVVKDIRLLKDMGSEIIVMDDTLTPESASENLSPLNTRFETADASMETMKIKTEIQSFFFIFNSADRSYKFRTLHFIFTIANSTNCLQDKNSQLIIKIIFTLAFYKSGTLNLSTAFFIYLLSSDVSCNPKRLLNLPTLPPVSTSFCLPV